eukprot:SAG31_NODE_3756_length_3912_cov_99.932074_5_plen_386_part_01
MPVSNQSTDGQDVEEVAAAPSGELAASRLGPSYTEAVADAAPVEQNDVADTSPKSSADAGIDEAVETGAVGREEEDAWSDRDNGGRTPSEDDAEVEVGESVIDAAAATTEEAEVEPVQSVLEAATTAQSEPAEASLVETQPLMSSEHTLLTQTQSAGCVDIETTELQDYNMIVESTTDAIVAADAAPEAAIAAEKDLAEQMVVAAGQKSGLDVEQSLRDIEMTMLSVAEGESTSAGEVQASANVSTEAEDSPAEEATAATDMEQQHTGTMFAVHQVEDGAAAVGDPTIVERDSSSGSTSETPPIGETLIEKGLSASHCSVHFAEEQELIYEGADEPELAPSDDDEDGEEPQQQRESVEPEPVLADSPTRPPSPPIPSSHAIKSLID